MTEYITTADAAAELGVSAIRIRQLIGDGRLPATKFGPIYMIARHDLASIVRRPAGRPRRRLPLPTGDAPPMRSGPEMTRPGAP